ncbi:BatA domain-containing protein [Salegentibacter flavus]|uniref:N-terminal double-transmembrane domain-containing protein n=1 Tax=Salegentibacter flavus TaxID=287099 RepID=A0A1I4YHB2_9FLAO|nr:BatA domain-containing protein [Salegentibacter flavus]SFN36979.1 N-terminal double-transmembrane domain-containing protein [Salegentibacter flavus]
MHFKQPEILFALVFLLIPLLVHLFQLRKYQKEDFTNVKFLKKISRETRKSSRLKKWLVLLTRMIALGSIIIAFAQPYLPARDQNRTTSEKVIYLDNSFSMQAIGKSGELLNTAIQDLLKNIPEEGDFHLITNTEEYKNLNAEELKTRLEQTGFSSKSLDFQDIEVKASQFSDREIPSEVIMLSDFQQQMEFPENFEGKISYHLVPYKAENNINFSLDSLYIEERDPEFLQLNFILKSNRENSDQITVSAFNADELLARKTFSLDNKERLEGKFQLRNEQFPAGRLEIEDNGLQYDNRLYFSINPPQEIKGAAISRELSQAGFLNRIFTGPEFEFHNFTSENIDYNLLSRASFIILNELEEMPSSLRISLEKMHKEGKTIVIIPSEENTAVNSFLGSLPASGYGNLQSQELLITNIAFEHPLLNGVFENEIKNFDYPRAKNHYRLTGGNKILGFQDNSAFLSEQGNIYLFAAPINSENSNFKNAPLVVPIFYNLGRTALALPQLYYQVNRTNQIEVPVESSGDEVVSLVSENENFIPAQQAFAGKVRLNNEDLPETAGNFSIIYKGEETGNISYNYSREESNALYSEEFNDAEVYNSVSEYFNNVRSATQSKALWKWFVILALIFLTAEMLLLKYLK